MQDRGEALQVKNTIAFLALMVLILGGSYLLLTTAFHHDQKKAEQRCSSMGAEPVHTDTTRYICVMSDGRVVR